jgi:hypothetical protein
MRVHNKTTTLYMALIVIIVTSSVTRIMRPVCSVAERMRGIGIGIAGLCQGIVFILIGHQGRIGRTRTRELLVVDLLLCQAPRIIVHDIAGIYE